MSDAEIDEAVHLAMTVGASKTLMLAKNRRRELDTLHAGEDPGDTAEGAAAFQAAEVVTDTGEG